MKEDLKQSNASYTGGTNGSLGEADMADLKRGYTKPGAAENEESTQYNTQKGGFCGRPHGWER